MVLAVLVLLINIIFFRGLFVGLVPIPLDALVGVYHPWADQFWGFVAGVPYKNIALTDVFSQLYPWRILAMDLVRSWQLPLWNPYSFMGGPLLANWQSAPFYPLNILMLLFGDVTGYGLMVAVQPLLSMWFMLLFLREIKVSKAGSFVGAVSFAFGGFMMTYLEYATTGQILTFIPLSLWLIERFLHGQKKRYLLGLPLAVFFILTGGFFQPAFYALLIISTYAFIASSVAYGKIVSGQIFQIFFFLLLGVGLAGLQLFPTAELLSLSIRNLDHNIAEYQYGLLPLKHLITLIAPDFFGNSATGNYSGFMQYQETSGYFGIVGLILALTALLFSKKNFRIWFFSLFFLVSLFLAFENPLSKMVFEFKLPLLSTGYASRWLMIFSFSGAVLSAFGFDLIKKKRKLLLSVLVLVLLGALYLTTKESVSTRNLILPLATTAAAILLFVVPQKKVVVFALCLLVTFDLLRYATKFTPMARSDYGTTQIPFIQKVHDLAGINRVAIDTGPLMSANTWIYGRIYTIGGYDPLPYKDSGIWFRAINVGINLKQKIDGSLGEGAMTRDLNLDNPLSPLLDLTGTKYLLTLKKDREGRFKSEGVINGELLKKYQVVDSFGASVLLENKTAMPRINLFYQAEGEMNDVKAEERLIGGFDFRNKILLKEEKPRGFVSDDSNSVELLSYSANRVEIIANTKNGAYLMLSDTDYPGWKATVNGSETKIIRADGIFRSIILPAGEARVAFTYFPDSFKNGLALTIASALALIAFAVVAKRKNTF